MKKVFIIGAGVGGLSAAARLLQYGFDVEVFEKNNTIGGKTNFIKYKDFKFDLTSSVKVKLLTESLAWTALVISITSWLPL